MLSNEEETKRQFAERAGAYFDKFGYALLK